MTRYIGYNPPKIKETVVLLGPVVSNGWNMERVARGTTFHILYNFIS